ncbi:uncharacterized protein LOC124697608 [Lolium rigidum]|uniref:uncharacterized protein LOC124697608 n=1 Tax=Lolium rigidum TaxID=89674 RepID=UPI001F5C6134|nr:uncharacterized protein LOC124697608 [Lolium rigidum]
MLSSLAIQDAAVTSSVSGRPEEQDYSHLVFSGHNLFSEESSVCTTTSTECNDPESWSLRSDEFIDRVNNRLLCHDGTGVNVFEVHFDLNSTHAAHLDKWVQFASKSNAHSVRLHLCKSGISCSGHSRTASPYNFPLHFFGDGQASSLLRLWMTNCIFRLSMYPISFSSLVSLCLMCVTIADSDIQSIFSCCPGVRILRLGSCNDLVNIRISGERLFHLYIYYCKNLVSIEIHSASLVIFEYDGHKVLIKYASTPNMRRISTKFSNRNCSLSMNLNKMKMIEKVCLTFLSPSKEPNFKLYAKKFTVLKYINLYILPSWNNVLAVAYLLQATPFVTRLRLEMKAYGGEQHHLENVQVSWPEDISLQKLHLILVGGFAAQPPLIGLLACLVGVAPGLKFLTISPRYHRLKRMGTWGREKDGAKAARDHARKVAREAIGLKLPSSVRFALH